MLLRFKRQSSKVKRKGYAPNECNPAHTSNRDFYEFLYLQPALAYCRHKTPVEKPIKL